MFKRHNRRSTNIVFVIFRLLLSLTIFILLLAGLYSAYKNFSGVDPLKLDLNSVVLNLESLTPPQIAKYLPFIKKGDSNTSLDQMLSQIGVNQSKGSVKNKVQSATKETAFNFVLIADSHSDNANLKKALAMIKAWDAQFLIGLGDYTDVGILDELKNAKLELDSVGIRYFLTPGDHDLWDSRDKSKSPLTNFNQVFGPSYQSFNYQNFKFIILFNSDNYIGIDTSQMDWLKKALDQAKEDGLNILVFVHEPLFHPSSDHVMGRVEPNLKDQARELIKLFVNAGVKKIFAGDTHLFSEYNDPETGLSMVTIGAITSERNLQLPRFGRVWVFKDGSIKVEDVEIK